VGAIVLIDAQTNKLSLGAHKDLTPPLVRILTGRQFDETAAILMPYLAMGKGALLELSETAEPEERRLLQLAGVSGLVTLPLQTGARLGGALVVGMEGESRFAPADLHCLLAIAQVTAVAWDTIYVREKLWRMAENLLSQGVISLSPEATAPDLAAAPAAPPLPPLQARLAEIIADMKGTMGAVFVIERDAADPEIHLAVDYGLSPLFTGAYAHCKHSDNLFPFARLLERDLLVVDLLGANKTHQIPLLKALEEEGARSLIAACLGPEEQPGKLFFIAASHPRVFSSASRETLAALARELLPLLADAPRLPTFPLRSVHVPSLERGEATDEDLEQLLAAVMEAEEEVERHNADFTTLNAISETLNHSLHLEQLLPPVLAQVKEMLRLDAIWVYLVDRGSSQPLMMQLSAQDGLDPATLRPLSRLAVGDGVEGTAAATAAPLFIGDGRQEDTPCHLLWELEEMEAIAAVPLTRPEEREGREAHRVVGVLAAGMRRPHFWRPRQIRLFNTVANQMAFAVNNAQLYAQVQDHLDELAASNQVLQAINRTLIENPIGRDAAAAEAAASRQRQ
jgi:transcriptional regulator with GAF, ATPase, and Fis domain